MMSLVESGVNTFGGFGVALWAQVHIFPWYGIHIALIDSAGIACIMLVISLVRQYIFRRFFAWLEGRPKHRAPTPQELLELMQNEGQLWDSSECKPLENNEQIVRLGQR
jgi:hypothetical protein